MSSLPLEPVGTPEARLVSRIWEWSAQAIEPIDAATIARHAAVTGARPAGLWRRLAGAAETASAVAGARRVWPARHRNEERARPMLTATRLIALVATVALGTGAVFLAAGQGPSPVPSASPSPTASPSGSTVVWEQVPLDFPLAPAEAGSAYTKILFIDGEFRVLEWRDTVHASVDGLTWRTVSGTRASFESDRWALQPWASFGGRTIVGYDDRATLLQVREPDGSVVSHQFRGPITQAVVGPGFILAVEHVMPEDIVQDVLGPEAAADAVIIDAEPGSGSIDVRLQTGERVHIVLADHGYSTQIWWDPYVGLLGWRSTDGVDWAPVHDRIFDQGQDLVGSADGVYELAYSNNDSELWTLSYSADGLAWQELGPLPEAGAWFRWEDRLLLPVDGHLMALTPQGAAELPLSAALLGQGGPLAGSGAQWVAGELGLVAFAPDRGLVAVSPDGETWSMSELPAIWTTGDPVTLRAVGRNAMLVKVSECRGPGTGDDCFGTDSEVSVLWRGVLQP